MKILTALVLTSAALFAAMPASAFRYEWQTVQLRQTMEKKQAENLARAQQQPGLAGATGAPGKVGPGTQPAKARKDPTAHP